MNERIATPEEMAKWVFIGAGAGFTVMGIVLWYAGDLGRAFAAGIVTYLILFNVGLFWRFRRGAAFWVALSFAVFAHALLIAYIPWPENAPAGRALWIVAAPDFFLIFACFKLAQKAFRRNAQTQ